VTEPVGVVSAGTMGAGIAQVAAVAGRRVLLADAVPGAAERAIAKIRDRVKAQVEKGRLDADPAWRDNFTSPGSWRRWPSISSSWRRS
jgi:3-hydroxybutyryl-CoA dehydrogenase